MSIIKVDYGSLNGGGTLTPTVISSTVIWGYPDSGKTNSWSTTIDTTKKYIFNAIRVDSSRTYNLVEYIDNGVNTVAGDTLTNGYTFSISGDTLSFTLNYSRDWFGIQLIQLDE